MQDDCQVCSLEPSPVESTVCITRRRHAASSTVDSVTEVDIFTTQLGLWKYADLGIQTLPVYICERALASSFYTVAKKITCKPFPMRKMRLTGRATLKLCKYVDVCTCMSVKCFIPKRKFH